MKCLGTVTMGPATGKTYVRAALEQFVYDMGYAPNAISETEYAELEIKGEAMFRGVKAISEKLTDPPAAIVAGYLKDELRGLLKDRG